MSTTGHQLAISCSSSACSVALSVNEQTLQLRRIKPRMHNRLLLPMIERLLTEVQTNIRHLDAIVCDVGPGALMGVRLGVAAAQSLAYAADLPVCAVSSLQSLAYRGKVLATKSGLSEYTILPMIDARLGQIYWSSYSVAADVAGSPSHSSTLPECEKVSLSLSAPSAIDEHLQASAGRRLVGLGSGWNHLAEFGAGNINPTILHTHTYPQGSDMLGFLKDEVREPQLLSPDKLQPIYLRQAV